MYGFPPKFQEENINIMEGLSNLTGQKEDFVVGFNLNHVRLVVVTEERLL